MNPMNKHTLAKRLPLVGLCIGFGVLAPLLAGCGNGAAGSHEMTKDDFKPKPMPPEAVKAMNEARSHAGPPPNAGQPANAPK